jgi:hypothetical protein
MTRASVRASCQPFRSSNRSIPVVLSGFLSGTTERPNHRTTERK